MKARGRKKEGGKKEERKRERKRMRIFHFLVFTPDDHSDQQWYRLRPRTRSYIQVSMLVAWAQIPAPSSTVEKQRCESKLEQWEHELVPL